MRPLNTHKPNINKSRSCFKGMMPIVLILFFSIFVNSQLLGQVVVDNTSSVGPITSGSTITVSHTTGSDDNRLMLVGISSRSRNVSSVTYDGVLLDPIVVLEPGNRMYTYVYQMLDPTPGTADVVVTFTANLTSTTTGSVGVMTFSNTDQVNPLGTAADNMANNSSPSVSVASSANQLIFNVLTEDTRNVTGYGSGQTPRWYTSGLRPRSAASTKPATGASTTMSYSLNNSTNWTTVSVPINPYPTSNLGVSKTVSKSNPSIGEVISFTITAVNNGPDAAGGVEVLDIIPSGYTYISNSPSLGNYDFNSGVWSIGTLNNGASATLFLEVVVNSSGPYINTASISGLVNDPVPGNNSANVGITICNAGITPPLYNN